MRFGHQDVLEHIEAPSRARVPGSANHDVPRLVPRSATLPVAVRLGRFVATGCTASGLRLLRLATSAGVPCSTCRTSQVSTGGFEFSTACRSRVTPDSCQMVDKKQGRPESGPLCSRRVGSYPTRNDHEPEGQTELT